MGCFVRELTYHSGAVPIAIAGNHRIPITVIVSEQNSDAGNGCSRS
jgi:hypothetical protein